MFRRRIIILSLVVGLAGTAAVAQGLRGRAAGRGGFAAQRLDRLQQRLNLSDTQVNGIRALAETRRNEMQSLMDAEAPQGERRARMIANFNRGFRGFQQTYRTCTPAADLVIRRYLEEGSKIAREVTARYAN